MNQVRLWSITNMGYSHDSFCFGNKKCSFKYIVLVFPYMPTIYSRLVSWEKFNLSRCTQLILRTLWTIETQYKIIISIYPKNLKYNAGFALLYLGNCYLFQLKGSLLLSTSPHLCDIFCFHAANCGFLIEKVSFYRDFHH